MLLEFLLLFQAGLLSLFYQAYSKRDEFFWAMSAVLSGIFTFLFYGFNTNDTAIVAALNAGVFFISLVWFFIDLLSNRASEFYKTNKFLNKIIPKNFLSKNVKEEKNGNATTTKQ